MSNIIIDALPFEARRIAAQTEYDYANTSRTIRRDKCGRCIMAVALEATGAPICVTAPTGATFMDTWKDHEHLFALPYPRIGNDPITYPDAEYQAYNSAYWEAVNEFEYALRPNAEIMQVMTGE